MCHPVNLYEWHVKTKDYDFNGKLWCRSRRAFNVLLMRIKCIQDQKIRLNVIHNAVPQYLQYVASASWPSALHSGQDWVDTLRPNRCDISTVTMPVGTAMMP
jgi:hypothetical protein